MLGLVALIIVAVTGFLWYRLIQDVAVPKNRAPYLAGFLGGGLLGLYAASTGGLVSTLAGGAAAFGGITFSLLRLQSAQKPNEPAVVVGDRMLAFTAPDASGADFDTARLGGKPYLLKFFRGHW